MFMSEAIDMKGLAAAMFTPAAERVLAKDVQRPRRAAVAGGSATRVFATHTPVQPQRRRKMAALQSPGRARLWRAIASCPRWRTGRGPGPPSRAIVPVPRFLLCSEREG